MLHPAFLLPFLGYCLADCLAWSLWIRISLFPETPKPMCSHPPASASQTLNLQARTTPPAFSGFFLSQKVHYRIGFLRWKHLSGNDK